MASFDLHISYLLGAIYNVVEFHKAPFYQLCSAVYAMEIWKTNCYVEYSKMGKVPFYTWFICLFQAILFCIFVLRLA